MKTYVLMVSVKFPKNHIKAGKPTGFVEKIPNIKIHTLRSNYHLWKKRFTEIEKGNACLSVRVWQDKAYRSKQLEVYRFNKSHGIGIEKYRKDISSIVSDDGNRIVTMSREILANNDGLQKDDFNNWFKHHNILQPLAVIHFTKFRYLN